MTSRLRLRDLGRSARFALAVARGGPLQALVQVTNRCNLTCPFCSFPAHAALPSQELTLAEYRRLADEMAALGSFIVSVEGGEPFLRPDLVEIVAAFGARHLPVLYTSGWFANPDLATRLWAAGLVDVGVSIDYPDAAAHDAHRGRAGSFDRAVAAVEAFRDAPGAGKVHLMTVVMDRNADRLEALLALSARLGVAHRVTLLSTAGAFRASRGPAAPPAGMARRLLELRARYPHFRSSPGYLGAVDGPPPAGCRAGLQTFNVGHTGDVTPCIEKGEWIAGNIRREPLRDVLDRLAARPEPRGCRDCWTLCRGLVETLGGGARRARWLEFVRYEM